MLFLSGLLLGDRMVDVGVEEVAGWVTELELEVLMLGLRLLH